MTTDLITKKARDIIRLFQQFEGELYWDDDHATLVKSNVELVPKIAEMIEECQQHNLEGTFACSGCPAFFVKRDELWVHYEEVHDKDPVRSKKGMPPLVLREPIQVTLFDHNGPKILGEYTLSPNLKATRIDANGSHGSLWIERLVKEEEPDETKPATKSND